MQAFPDIFLNNMGSITGSIISALLVIAAREWWLRPLDQAQYIGSFQVPLLKAGFRMKMVMFDVSDKTNVSVKATLDLGDTYSEALNDPNAILVSPDKNLIGFATNSGYTFYSYSDDAGFTKLASVAGGDWDYNMRGLYIGDFLYIVSQSGVTVVELASYTTVATVAV